MLYVNKSPVKILCFMLSFALAILSYQPRAQAGDQSKALIGGAIAAIIAGGIAASQAEPPVASPPQDNSNIAWETPQPQIKKAPSQAEIKEREKVKAIQKALAKINFYGGDIDGIAGSGTSEAIQYWEYEFDQVKSLAVIAAALKVDITELFAK